MKVSNAIELELSRLAAIQADFCCALGSANREAVADISVAIDGSEDPDGKLSSLADSLRAKYLRSMAARTSSEWRTPNTGASRAFPGHPATFRHAYDRSHPAEALADRIQFGGEVASSRIAGGTVSSSGMAAINLAIQSLAHVHRRETLRLGAFASYFETHTLLRLSAAAGRWSWLRSECDLLEGITAGLFNVIFLETIQWNWTLSAIDWSKLVEALNRSAAPPAVVLDTTLTGSSRQTQDVIKLLLASNVPAVIRVRSCLKLDQQGLELGNLGAVSWGIRCDAESGYLRFPSVIDSCRVVSGAGVGWHEACVLSPRFVADEVECLSYSELVMEANRCLLSAVPLNGDLFRRPAFPEPPWAAPFVLYILESEAEACYERLAVLLHKEVQRRGLRIAMSGSFGFRQLRYETFVVNEQKRAGERPGGALKVAAGAFVGAEFWKMAALLEELFEFDALEDAERHFGKTTISSVAL